MEFSFRDKRIRVMEEDLSSRRYQTVRYKEAMEIIKKEDIRPLLILEALEWFFYENKRIPMNDKFAISEISFDYSARIIKIKTTEAHHIYESRNFIARKTGWYFYTTGASIPMSELSILIDQIPKRFDISYLKWNLEDDTSVKLKCLASGPNRNAYLLTIGTKNVLLDAGFSNTEKIALLKQTGDLDAAFISHAHRDHTGKLVELVQNFQDMPVILSQTTLDCFLLQRTLNRRNFTEGERTLIKNSVIVKNNDFIPLAKGAGYFQFFFSGHMPGSLMFFAEVSGFKFLFTGDYSYYDHKPIPGIYGIIYQIPRPIDFLLVDGCFSASVFQRPKHQFDFLRSELTSSARDMGRILIVADAASLAIIIIMTIHNHFIRLKEREHFERPYIFLNQKVYEYAQILCTRLQDLHPNSARSVEEEFNPFQSAMIKWIKSKKDIKEAERLMKTEKSRGFIVILDPSDMGKNWVADFLKIIASDQYNAIYFAGKLKDEISIELVSGEDNLTLKDGTILQNKARILNRTEPRNILNLHADRLQLEKLLKELRPRKVCLFHQNPQNLSSVRRWINEKYPFVNETYALYGTKKEIQIKH